MYQIEIEKRFHNEYFSKHSSRKREDVFYGSLSKDIILDDIFRRFFGALKGKRILYYGCGENISIFEYFMKQGADVFLVDLSEIAIEKIKSRYPNIKAAVMDAHNMTFEDNYFDFIFGRAILHHLNLGKATREINRVLNKQGKAVFIEPLGMNPLLSLYRYLTPGSRTIDEHPFVFRDINILKSGFRLFSSRYFYFLSLMAIIFNNRGCFFKKLFFRLHKFDQVIFKLLPPLRYMSWIGVFEVSK